MFFILSKVLNFLIQPFFYVCLAFVLSLVIKSERKKKRLRTSGVILLFFFSNTFIVDEFYRWWELPAVPIDSLEHYDCAIVLGGMTGRYDAENDRVNFHGGVDRLLQTMLLQKNFKVDKILLSSGSGYLMHPEEKEALLVGDFFHQLDYDMEDFWLETESRNTRENAAFSLNMVKEKFGMNWEDKKYLLVSSGYHLRRGLGCFKKIGFNVDVYATNLKAGPREFNIEHVFLPNAASFSKWNALLHEVIGFLTYKIMGYI